MTAWLGANENRELRMEQKLRRLKQHTYSANHTRNKTYPYENEQHPGGSSLINYKSDQRFLHPFGSVYDVSRYNINNRQEGH